MEDYEDGLEQAVSEPVPAPPPGGEVLASHPPRFGTDLDLPPY